MSDSNGKASDVGENVRSSADGAGNGVDPKKEKPILAEVEKVNSDFVNIIDHSGEVLELPTSQDNALFMSTLQSSFPGATGLKYKNPKTGASRAVQVDPTGTKLLAPADGWDDKVFSVIVTPQSSAPVYVPIETDALVHQLEKYLFYEKGDTKACFTVISNHHAVSFNHGPHQNWNTNSAENQTSVTICNLAGQEFQTQLIACNADMDFVVVLSEVPLVPVPPTISFPRKLERYILLGFPNVNSSYQALEGIFSSVQLDNEGRIRGSSGSQRGYSGGPIFNYKGELLGINVANESSTKFIGLSGRSTMDDLFNEVNAAFPSLSIIVPVYYLAMGIHEKLNFQQ